MRCVLLFALHLHMPTCPRLEPTPPVSQAGVACRERVLCSALQTCEHWVPCRPASTERRGRIVRQVLNQIIVSLPEAHPVQENGRPVLRDTLGHTPAQVGTPATRARTHTSPGLRSTTGSASHAGVRYATQGGLPHAAVSANQ